MTVLRNTIHIEAPPERVWAVLARLDALGLVAERSGTRVDQIQEYALKYGPVGSLLDALFVRRKWDSGVRSFLSGLKSHVEALRTA